LITFEHPFGDAIHEIFINVENGRNKSIQYKDSDSLKSFVQLMLISDPGLRTIGKL
jgi:hypothetical protein